MKRAQRGAEREELLASSRSSPPGTATSSSSASAPRRRRSHVDLLELLRADATRERLLGAERAAEAVRETWRRLEEFHLAPQLALEALFVLLARELGGRTASLA